MAKPVETTQKAAKVPHILVYGIGRVGVGVPRLPIDTSLFRLDFELFYTERKLHEYDGVIIFQSTFEKVKLESTMYADSYYTVKWDEEELVTRRAQLRLLLEKGGFVCFILHTDFVDGDRYGDYQSTDLCKIYLNDDGINRAALSGYSLPDRIKRDEFRPFLKEYGAAKTLFTFWGGVRNDVRLICLASRSILGFILCDNRYFVPARLPKVSEVTDYFINLASALVASWKKLREDVPPWTHEYKFATESQLEADRTAQLEKLDELSSSLRNWINYKGVLAFHGERLVESVALVLNHGLRFNLPDKDDEFIEDKVILDDKGQDDILIEIKGTNENAKSDHVYQADSHRGRREKPDDFPSLLIINTFIKSANSIGDKDKSFNSEQVRLAVKKRVLMMRTLDLLNLLKLKEAGTLTKDQIAHIFRNQVGWLRVSEDGYHVLAD